MRSLLGLMILTDVFTRTCYDMVSVIGTCSSLSNSQEEELTKDDILVDIQKLHYGKKEKVVI